MNIDNKTRKALVTQNIPYKIFFTTPTPLNNWLWYVVAKADSGFYVGYRSVFDKKQQIDFHYFPKNEFLLRSVSDHEELQHLIRFSQNYYTIEAKNGTLLFNDLRFGQVAGWYDPEAAFTFHYYLNAGGKGDKLVVQRGRFANWNETTLRSLVTRIAGN